MIAVRTIATGFAKASASGIELLPMSAELDRKFTITLSMNTGARARVERQRSKNLDR